MVIAGEASGDALASELVLALSEECGPEKRPVFFGAGGEKMAAAGVELLSDLASHAVVGMIEVVKNYGRYRRIFAQLLAATAARKPAVIILVDFSGFNRRFASAVRDLSRRPGSAWNLRIVYYVSPQVWASRPGRARTLERDIDLLLAIFPFEKAWYEAHAPKLRVEFVGHPLVSRYADFAERIHPKLDIPSIPSILLLPGSRKGELTRHLPILLEAAVAIEGMKTARWIMVLPDAQLLALAKEMVGKVPLDIRLQIGGLGEALLEADLAMASTGTVTMECAFFRVPTVTLYKTSWSTYQIGRRIIQVRFLTMPNLLADEEVFPEFVQHDATSARIAGAAIDLLDDRQRRADVQEKLARIISTLGPPVAARRAAQHILNLVPALKSG